MTTTPYSKVRKALDEQSGDGNQLPCRHCQAMTPWATLSELGARCKPCYDAYCRDAFAPSPRAQTSLPRVPGRISVLASGEPKSAGPEHAFDALPLD